MEMEIVYVLSANNRMLIKKLVIVSMTKNIEGLLALFHMEVIAFDIKKCHIIGNTRTIGIEV